MQFKIIPIPQILKNDVECIRITEYDGEQPLAINVCLNALPGIVFQHHNGRSPVENITTRFSRTVAIPTLYVYGQMTEPGVMNHKQEPFTTTQIVLKPHALQSLLGLNAFILTNNLIDLSEFSARHLNMQLLEARSDDERLRLLIAFLVKKRDQAKTRDCLIEQSLRFIHNHIGLVTVKQLLEYLSLSERQFEKRFTQAVGLSPQFYIRVKRFNEALHLMKTRPFEKLTDIAYHLNYYDQSHFIRDVKAFSGLTPKSLFQKVDFHADQRVIAY
jgi:AraC-like DNA-binding protein